MGLRRMLLLLGVAATLLVGCDAASLVPDSTTTPNPDWLDDFFDFFNDKDYDYYYNLELTTTTVATSTTANTITASATTRPTTTSSPEYGHGRCTIQDDYKLFIPRLSLFIYGNFACIS